MAATMTLLDQYRAEMEAIPSIGDLLWFTVEESAKVSPTQLHQWFVELGLDEGLLPNPIKPVDAFRRATGITVKEQYHYDDGSRVELMVREVTSDPEHVVRHIVRETCDQRGRRLSYDKIGECVFYRAGQGGNVTTRFGYDATMLGSAEEPIVQTFVQRMQDTYQQLTQYLHSDAIRGVLRKYVLSLNAILCRPSGGIYFVHASRRTTVLALDELVRRIGPDCMFHLTPLPDTGRQREMLSNAFQDQITGQMDTLLKRIAEVNTKYKSKPVPPSVYADISNLYKDAMERSEEYTLQLGLTQGKAASALEIALEAVMDLASRIGVK